MARLLEDLSRGIDRRFTLYRRMSANLGLDLTEDQACAHRADLRMALLACAGCRNTDACMAWLDQGHPDAPLFCRGRDAFLRLPRAPAPFSARRAAARSVPIRQA